MSSAASPSACSPDPPLAGVLVERFGTAAPFLVAAGIAVIDGVLRIVLVKGSPRVSDDTAGPLVVLRVPGSVSIVVGVAIGAAVLSGVEPVLPVHLGAGSLTVGLLFGLAAVAAMIANAIVSRSITTASPRTLIGAGILAVAAALIVLGFTIAGVVFLYLIWAVNADDHSDGPGDLLG